MHTNAAKNRRNRSRSAAANTRHGPPREAEIYLDDQRPEAMQMQALQNLADQVESPFPSLVLHPNTTPFSAADLVNSSVRNVELATLQQQINQSSLPQVRHLDIDHTLPNHKTHNGDVSTSTELGEEQRFAWDTTVCRPTGLPTIADPPSQMVMQRVVGPDADDANPQLLQTLLDWMNTVDSFQEVHQSEDYRVYIQTYNDNNDGRAAVTNLHADNQAIVRLNLIGNPSRGKLLSTFNHEMTLHVYPDYLNRATNANINTTTASEHDVPVQAEENDPYHQSQIQLQNTLAQEHSYVRLKNFTKESIDEIDDTITKKAENYAGAQMDQVIHQGYGQDVTMIETLNAVLRVQRLCNNYVTLLEGANLQDGEERIAEMRGFKDTAVQSVTATGALITEAKREEPIRII